jgi:hypothetical protein
MESPLLTDAFRIASAAGVEASNDELEWETREVSGHEVKGTNHVV